MRLSIKAILASILPLLALSCTKDTFTLSQGQDYFFRAGVTNFTLQGEFRTHEGAVATISFHDNGKGGGYKVLLSSGPIDGSLRTGSLMHVRNLYRSLEQVEEWTPIEVSVRGKNISVRIKDEDVVCYTEPDEPYRTASYAGMRLGNGKVGISCEKGTVDFRGLSLAALAPDAKNPCDTLPPVDENTDRAILLQQEDFPVIDWHVHLKGGLTSEMAHAMSMNYGINYGVAPNAGAGGVGRMLSSDEEVYEYFEEVKNLPFLRGVQGEGRKWTADFSSEALGVFDYLFTDAMTIVDGKGRICRIYRNEEVLPDGMSDEQYMDMIVDQTVKILSNEPADIFANAFFLPEFLSSRFDEMWTPERVSRVLDVMSSNGIALEISARYCIPNEYIVREALSRGIKFTFGTNNVDANFGRLEYSIDLARKCGVKASDMWFPSMSTRASRPTIIYNNFSDGRRDLFNGRDLEGWVPVLKEESEEPVFKVEDGMIVVSGKPNGYLRTTRQWGDYTLHVEWKWIGEGTNSGIFQRVQAQDTVWPVAYECQLQAGHAGDVLALGGATITSIPLSPSSRFPRSPRRHPDSKLEFPDGEWNRAEIICRGNRMTVYINGSLENDVTIAHDRGFIALQSEGGTLAFRNIYIE